MDPFGIYRGIVHDPSGRYRSGGSLAKVGCTNYNMYIYSWK